VQSFWAFLCGRIPEIQVRVRSLSIGPELRGDYFSDREYRRRFQSWLNDLWTQKDAQIEALLRGRSAVPRPAPRSTGVLGPRSPQSTGNTVLEIRSARAGSSIGLTGEFHSRGR
jgi:hypothetical protein